MTRSSSTLDAEVSFGAQSARTIAAVGGTDGSVLVVPVGSIEQHGTHLPVATDTLLAERVATASAKRVVADIPILVAPSVRPGYSPHHLPVGGTLSAGFETLLDLLRDMAETGLDNGFDALVFVNGHGGNTSLIDAAVSEIGREHPDREILGLTYFELVADLAATVRESDLGGMAHGGEFETSMMLYLFPELVETDEMPAEYWDEHYEHGGDDLVVGGPLSVYRSFDEYSESGAIGDPSVADENTGRQLFDGAVTSLSDLLIDVHEKNSE
ncbi:creatininase family protein [Halogeometricum borinquense]|uniref:Creatininase family protein n=1 Tax=Halogeometricum borinquense TaxID=60847 RepID=A0A6C0UF04_9EURY|nr:creatininase family protein [Halogeometricum borinquense]QIB74012.1 creatininase family protein [Halogeometricum borinquense]